jgi:23S rRNA-/tRNA-specific pseudouridylate synthase
MATLLLLLVYCPLVANKELIGLMGTSPLHRAVSNLAGVTEARARELVALGAAHVACVDGKRKWQREFDADATVAGETVLRLFASPKRFPQAAALRVLYADDHFVVVDKPPGVPAMPLGENYAESAQGAACAALGLGPRSLSLVNRLDACTSGCLVLARSAKAQATFGRWLDETDAGGADGADGALGVRKVYVALVSANGAEAREAVGRLVGRVLEHDVLPEKFATRVRAPSPRAPEGLWRRARLRVRAARPMRAPEAQAASLVQSGSSAWGLVELELELLTGKRHQIRAQLAAEGLPIVGDSLYEPLATLLHAPPPERERADGVGAASAGGGEEAGDDEARAQWDEAVARWHAPDRIALHALRVEMPPYGDARHDAEATAPPSGGADATTGASGLAAVASLGTRLTVEASFVWWRSPET